MISERSQPRNTRHRARHSNWNSLPTTDIAAALRNVRADAFTLYTKTNSHHWHRCGPDFREYEVVLEDQAKQLFFTTETITERMRAIGGIDIRTIEQSGLPSTPSNGNADFVDPEDALAELRVDNQILTGSLRSAQELCARCGDIVTASLIDVWIDEARRRAWILFEVTRRD